MKKAMFQKGNAVMMNRDALENYGLGHKGRVFVITHVSTKYMPSGEFYQKGRPDGFHPGYDETMEGMGLYDLADQETGESLGMSLYDWELSPA